MLICCAGFVVLGFAGCFSFGFGVIYVLWLIVS